MLLAIFLIPAAFSNAAGQAETDPATFSYLEHRTAFQTAKQELDKTSQDKKAAIELEITQARERIAAAEENITVLRSSIADIESRISMMHSVLAVIAFFFFPIATLFAAFIPLSFHLPELEGIILVFLILTAVNLSLFIFFRSRNTILSEQRVGAILLLVLFISVFAAPLLAQGSSAREKITEQLDYTKKILSSTGHSKYIAILESAGPGMVHIPDLPSGSPLLKVYPTVTVSSAEYYLTLAALYEHEKQTNKAVQAIGTMARTDTLRASSEHDRILINSIKFLIQQQHTGLAAEIIDKLAGNLATTADVLELAAFALNSLPAQAGRLILLADSRAASSSDLVRLAELYDNTGYSSRETDALTRAADSARTIEDLILAAEFAISRQETPLISQIMARVTEVTGEFKDPIAMVDLFLEQGLREEGIEIFAAMDDHISPSTNDFTGKLLFLIYAALERDLLDHAITATSKLSLYLGDAAYQYTVPPIIRRENFAGIPDINQVSLPLFYGLLNEELGRYEQAESVYIRAVMHSIAGIRRNAGGEIGSLNPFFLLGRTWHRENRMEQLASLNTVYTLMEEQTLARLSASKDRQLASRRNELAALRQQTGDRLAQLDDLQKQYGKMRFKLAAISSAATAGLLFISVIIAGCSFLSYRYSQSLSTFKIFGFISKFIELTSWVRIMSIIGFISGIIGLFFAQFLQMIHKLHENDYSRGGKS